MRHQRSQGKNLGRTWCGDQGGRNTSYWFALPGLFPLPSYTTLDHQPKVGFTHSELAGPLTHRSSNQENGPQACPLSQSDGGHFLNGGSLFSNDSNLRQVDKKLRERGRPQDTIPCPRHARNRGKEDCLLVVYKVVDILRDSRSAVRPGISVLSTECACMTCCGIMGKSQNISEAQRHIL